MIPPSNTAAEKRPSLNLLLQQHKSSYSFPHPNDPSTATAKMHLAERFSHQLTPPRKDKPISSTAGQLFLCLIGTILSMSVCVWLALFSTDVRWRRMVFASAAFVCAAMFTLLAMATIRRNKK